MDKGFSVVIGMTIAYAVSFFGLLLAYIVYQRNHHYDDLWRKRPVGVSFFAALYGYILPVLFLINCILTLAIKFAKGWEFNSFVWNTQALIWPVPVGIILFWLLGRRFWRMDAGGYAAALAVTASATAVMIYLVAYAVSAGHELTRLGVFATGLLWHLVWMIYLLGAKVRRSFSKQGAPA
ncbi:MAG TPA: hypothetical protein VM123_13785 [archaeon]|nr:hypothetical protein [archaeon]